MNTSLYRHADTALIEKADATTVDATASVPVGADVFATVSMIAYGLVIALGFARVFGGWNFFAPMAVITVMGFGVSFVARRLNAPGWLAVPIQVLVLGWLTLELNYGASMRYLLPTSTTWDLLANDLALVREQFPTAIAPVVYVGGWALLAGIGMAITVVMSDAFAFRADACGEALVPGGVLFIFISALAYDRLRVPITVLLVFVGVVTVYALRCRDSNGQRRLHETAGGRYRSLPALVVLAAGLAVVSGLIGPLLPGAKSDPLYNTHRVSGGITNVTSPLVDIRSRLINQSASTMFRVTATAPSYWRSTTLPSFDGTTFRLPTRSLEHIDSPDDEEDAGVEIRQDFEIVTLTGVLVPAAADPVAAMGVTTDGAIELRLNRETSTLVSTQEIEPGDKFTINSQRPAVTADDLRRATTNSPPDKIFVELPENFPTRVGNIAHEVTASAPTNYDKVLVLQNWFRANFQYSTEVQAGHSNTAIESFLDGRVGYCEQFSAAFAAMTRTLGIPSRVAVGFTQGDRDESGRYTVRGKNAHAWPEVWFDGVGWIAFEPTPGRGAPGAEDITGVPSQQDEGPTGPTITAPERATPVTTVVREPKPRPRPTGTAPTTLPAASNGQSSGSSLLVLWVVLVLAVLAALPWLIRKIRAGRNRHREPTERVGRAWKLAQRATTAAGVDTTASTTITEWVNETAAAFPVAAQPSRSLAVVVEKLTFAPDGEVDLERESTMGTTLVDDCENWARQIVQVTDDTLSVKDRVVRYLSIKS